MKKFISSGGSGFLLRLMQSGTKCYLWPITPKALKLPAPVAALALLLAASSVSPGAVRYVDLNSSTPAPPFTSWTTAATNIQDAVDAAIAGDEIVVGDGVYQTGGRAVGTQYVLNRVVLDKPLLLRSVNGPEVTVIRGNLAKTLEDFGVRCVYMAEGAVLSGFTLTNGWAAEGAGVWCESASAIITNCVVRGNSCGYGNGGGAYRGTLIDCVVEANSVVGYGGGTYEATLYNCSLTNNRADHPYFDYDDGGGGGGPGVPDPDEPAQSATVDEDIVAAGGGGPGVPSGGFGGGAYGGTLNNCILSGNQAGYEGGGAYEGTLNNCTLSGNSAGNGGGGASGGTLNNCTVAGNSAHVGGGVYWSTLNNCIVYYNSATTNSNHSSSTFNYSCTTPLPAGGTGNIADEPMFVSLETGDFRLQLDSPCINAGNNAHAPGTTDLDGNPRILGGTVDMGAYESVPPTSAELVEALIALLNESNLLHKQPLLATLNAAMASIQRGNSHSAAGQLHAFQNKVSAQVTDSALATELIAAAAEVIAALGRDNSQEH